MSDHAAVVTAGGSPAATPTAPARGLAAQTRRCWAAARPHVLAALPPWAVARVLVLGALAVAHFLVTNLHVHDPAVVGQVHQGLFAWDAGFYRGIAEHGYGFGAVRHDAVRFFPLLPLAARGLGTVLGGRADVAVLVIVETSALVLGALVHHLVLTEGRDPSAARRATWLMALFPSAFVLVLGYAEAPALAFAVGAFLALRARRWWWAAGLCLLAALTRPLGVLLVVPAAVEAGRLVRARGPLRPGVAAAVLGAPVGLAVFLTWSWRRYGDFWLPVRVQTEATHRGSVVNPFTAIWHEGRGILRGQHVGSALHVPWAIVLVALTVVCFRRWPASYGAFAAAVLAVALSSKNLDSLERYALGAFPLVLTLADLVAAQWLDRAVLVLSAAAFEGYALLAFLNAYVP
jgi:hypothetical protein